MSSIKQNDGRGQLNSGEEVSCRFVVTGSESPKLLELAEEILDEMARLVHLLVIAALDFAIGLGRDHQGLACCKQGFDHTFVSIENFVCQQRIRLHLRQQRIIAFQIMCLTGCQEEGKRIAQGVDQRIDFGAQSAFATPILVFTVFFGAGLCRCAGTILLSIMGIRYRIGSQLLPYAWPDRENVHSLRCFGPARACQQATI